jgi:excinuclease ABC subunit C
MNAKNDPAAAGGSDGLSTALQRCLQEMPDEPGVYLMRDERGDIIYIGKARSLRNRVRTYFTRSKDVKTRYLQARIHDIETIGTRSELEALLLENNLIKRWKPKYNINLKDGKTYPVIKLTREEYPRVYRTRRIVFDGSEYFGPYADVQQIDLYLDLIEQLFPLRTCKGPLRTRSRPCLNYYIGRCSGICGGRISREEYMERVEKVRRLLSGETEELARELEQKMREAAGEREYEKAGRYRDRLRAIETLSAEQQVVDFVVEDRDYVGLWVQEPRAGVTVLQMRGGKLVGREVFQFEDYSAEEEEILSHFLSTYYGGPSPQPGFVYLSTRVDTDLYSRFLREITGRELRVVCPEEGRDAQLVQLALEAARQRLEEGGVRQARSLAALQEALGLAAPPRRIEGFDIAHLAGEDTVASMVVFADGEPLRSDYRHFKIRTLQGRVDDFAAIREVVARRYTRVVNEGGPRPDLILIDGGKGQLGAARGILKGLGLNETPVAGLAKEREEIFLPDRAEPLVLEATSPALRLLQAVRDESHRFATGFHKRLRDKKVQRSLLETFEGIGPKRSKTLLARFGSLRRIAEGETREIASILRISAARAAALRAELRRLLQASGDGGTGR